MSLIALLHRNAVEKRLWHQRQLLPVDIHGVLRMQFIRRSSFQETGSGGFRVEHKKKSSPLMEKDAL